MQASLIKSSVLVLFMALTAAVKAEVPVGDFKLDPAHSKIGFEIPHLVISTVEGKFKTAEGDIKLGKQFKDSQIKVNVDIASIDTGVDKRDEHLRSPDFFDATKFPKMSFESKKITGKPEAFKLTGDLTIKGITKSVTFDAKYLGIVPDGYGNEKAAFKASAEINRKDFGLTWSNVVEAGPVVGDKVTIELTIQAGRPLKK